MPIAHVATAGTVRAELADAQAQASSLKQELAAVQAETEQVQRAGDTVLRALEAAIAPLMAELAILRRQCAHQGLTGPWPKAAATASSAAPEAQTSSDRGVSAMDEDATAALEAEIKHLQLDISHNQQKVERMQADERQREQEIQRLQTEVAEAQESLGYEQQRLRHFEVCQKLGPSAGGWAGLGPNGIGRRTMEVRAEKRLRECAELRAGRLAGQVTRLSSDTSTQQVTIGQLSKRLQLVRSLTQKKEQQQADASMKIADLKLKLKKPLGPASGNDLLGAMKEEVSVQEAVADAQGKLGGGRRPKKNSSTGKLPQLSF